MTLKHGHANSADPELRNQDALLGCALVFGLFAIGVCVIVIPVLVVEAIIRGVARVSSSPEERRLLRVVAEACRYRRDKDAPIAGRHEEDAAFGAAIETCRLAGIPPWKIHAHEKPGFF